LGKLLKEVAMPYKLSQEEIIAMIVLGEKKTVIARRLGVVEGTVRYHLKRKAGRLDSYVVTSPHFA
jgi:DNA-binding NarL/FixJ family response regulator